MSLNPRRETFADQVAAGVIPTDAARRAGYAPSRAAATASELMKHPDVRERIELTRSQLLVEAGYDPVDSVLTLIDEQHRGQNSRDRVRAAEVLLKLAGYFDEERPEQHLHLSAVLDRLTPSELSALASRPLAGEADGAWAEGDPVPLPPGL